MFFVLKLILFFLQFIIFARHIMSNQEEQELFYLPLSEQFEDESNSLTREYQQYCLLFNISCLSTLMRQMNLITEQSQILKNENHQDAVQRNQNQQNYMNVNTPELPLNQNSHKGKSSRAQNNPKLLCKIIYELFQKNIRDKFFSVYTKKYLQFAIESIKQKKSKTILRQILLDNSPTIISRYSQYLRKTGIELTFQNSSFIKQFQKQLRQFIVHRKQTCLMMASTRKIVDQSRQKDFIPYISTFIDDLQKGVIQKQNTNLKREEV